MSTNKVLTDRTVFSIFEQVLDGVENAEDIPQENNQNRKIKIMKWYMTWKMPRISHKKTTKKKD